MRRASASFLLTNIGLFVRQDGYFASRTSQSARKMWRLTGRECASEEQKG